MKNEKLRLFLLTIFLAVNCFSEPSTIVEDISKEVLLEEYPGNGVFSLRLTSEGYASRNGEPVCNPTENEYIQIVCDAEAACIDVPGTDKLVCMYDAMKKPINQYERSLKSNKGKKEKVSHHHDERAFAAWKAVKEVHLKLKHFVNDLRESGETDEDQDSSGDLVEKIQELYAMIQQIKETYGPANQVRLLVKIESIEILHPEKGWLTLSYDEIEVDLAALDLNRLLVVNSLEPADYKAIRIKFGEENTLRTMLPGAIDLDQLEHVQIIDGMAAYPLEFNSGDTRSRALNMELPITASKETEIAVSLDMNKSYIHDRQNDKFIFDPVFIVEGLSGDEFSDPKSQINLDFDGGNLNVSAAPGTFDKPVRFEAAALTENDLPKKLPGEGSVLLGAYEMKPDMVFDQAVTLTFRYDSSLLSQNGYGAESIRVRYFHEGRKQWMPISSYTVDEWAGTVRVHTNHFTIIVVDASKGFKLVYPKAITTKVQFSALNYVIERGQAINPVILKPQNINFDIDDGDSLSADGTIYLNEIDSRHFKFSVNHVSGDKIGVRVKLSNFKLGTFWMNFRKYGKLDHVCYDQVYTDCRADCKGWWDMFKPVCYGWCNYLLDMCRSINMNGTAAGSFTMNDMDMQLNFSVKRDPDSGILSVKYAGFKVYGMAVDIDPFFFVYKVTNKWEIEQFLIYLFATEQIQSSIFKTFKFHNEIAEAMGDKNNDKMIGKIKDDINKSLADSPVSFDFLVGAGGIETYADIDADIPAPPVGAGSCNVNLGSIADVPNVPINLPSGTDMGMGFSMTAVNQLINELARRGYYCFTHEIDPLTQTVLTIKPAALPEIKYLGNYLSRVRVAMTAEVSSFGRLLYVRSGSVDLYYRFGINLGGNELRMNVAKILASFDDKKVQKYSDAYLQILNAKIDADPSYYGYSLRFSNPMNYADFQHSMFRLNMVEEINGMMVFGIELGGLKVDYENNGGNTEWIWTKNHHLYEGVCAPRITGEVVASAPGGSTPKEMLLSSGERISLEEQKEFNLAIGSKVSLGGYCINDPNNNVRKYYATNVITDQFYIGPNNFPMKKKDWAAQVIDEYETTTGLFPINIKGDNIPEILQVQLMPDGEYQLDWILSKKLISRKPMEAIRHTMPLPSQFDPPQVTLPPGVPAPKGEPLYRVEILKSTSGYDQLLLNCYIYDVTVNNNLVQLTLVETICQNPYAGMVVDEKSGLMWTRCVIGQKMYDPDCAGKRQSAAALNTAKSLCSQLKLAGFHDWRLPSKGNFSKIPSQSTSNLLFPKPNGMYWVTDPSYAKTQVIKSYLVDKDIEFCGITSRVRSRTCRKYKRVGYLWMGSWYKFSTNTAGTWVNGSPLRGYYDFKADSGQVKTGIDSITYEGNSVTNTYLGGYDSKLQDLLDRKITINPSAAAVRCVRNID